MGIYLLLAVTAASIIICHLIAKKRGLNPIFWGVMGLAFGPLAIPLVCLIKPSVAAGG